MAIKRSRVPFTLVPGHAGPARVDTRTRHVDPVALRFDRAMQHLEAGEWDAAYADLSELANQGHPPAARIALLLARRGTSLFGGMFAATPQERDRWQQHGEG